MARDRRRPRRGFGASAEPSTNGASRHAGGGGAAPPPPTTNGAPDAPPEPETSPDDHGPHYFIDQTGGLSMICQRYDGRSRGWVAGDPRRLTNFAARITRNRVEDDGQVCQTYLTVEATLGGRTVSVPRLPADEFTDMSWALVALGGGAIIYPGRDTKDHARTAVQVLSGDVPTQTVCTHLGWRREGGRWVYLTAGSVIGADGPVGGLTVDLPAQLQRFALPDPPTGSELRDAIRAALGLLAVGPDRVSAPLLCSVARAPLGHAPFAVHLFGGTGVRKSTVAALAQQFFGPAMDHDALPVSWRSTANAIEQYQFAAQDTLLVLDDLNPMTAGRGGQKADDVLRSQANGTSRERMTRDLRFRQSFPPRGSLLSTGEDLGVIQSALARVLVVRVGPGDICTPALNLLQPLAARGVFAAAMAGYIQWLAPRLDAILCELPQRVRETRDAVQRTGDHGRTAEMVAQLLFGADKMLQFAREVGALTAVEVGSYSRRVRNGLLAEASQQASAQLDASPAVRFRELLAAAFLSGRAHLANALGHAPPHSHTWGWRDETAQGDRIGWVTDDGVYLDRDATYRILCAAVRDYDETLPTPKALWHALLDAGLLASTGAAEQRQTVCVRRTFSGTRHEVLHLRLDRLCETGASTAG